MLSRYAAAALLTCLFVSVGSAQAAERFASPAGNNGTDNCLAPQSPCSLTAALSTANLENGDTVNLAPGTYVETGTLEIPKVVTVSGEAGKERPLIRTAGTIGSAGLSSTQIATLRDLRIESVAGTAMGFKLTGGLGTVVERVESTGKAAFGCYLRAGTIDNSLCEATPALEQGVGLASSLISATPASMPVTVENVTAVGGHVGIEVGGGNQGGIFAYVYNTIALGGNTDVLAATSGENSGATILLEHSNYDSAETTGSGSRGVTPNTEKGNQSVSPVFVDESAGDFREAATSPTIRAGDTAHAPGAFDLDLSPRTTACEGTTYVDIGAYELGGCPPPPPPSGGGSGGSSTTPTPSTAGSTPTVSPTPLVAGALVLSKLSLKPAKWTTGGTTITFTLSAVATVKLEIRGKVVRTVKGKAGPNSVKFNGKLKGKALAPGSYTLRASAGTSSQTKKFRVLAAAS
jgi:hypothetical protein